MKPIIEIHVSDDITEYILWCWDTYKKNEDNLISSTIKRNRSPLQHVATTKGIQSKNLKTLKDFMEDNTFQDCLKFLWETLQTITGENLYYNHIHFVEYERGGYQIEHNHARHSPAHNEDYSAVFYLNTCRGGETFFTDPPKSFSPKKGDMIFFPADFTHGAKKTSSWFVKKKVLVLGLRKD